MTDISNSNTADPTALPLSIPSVWKGSDPLSEANAKLDTLLALFRAHLTPEGMKRGRTPREKKPPTDPLAELVDVIRIVKEAKGLPFDEAATRGKLADPAFRRAAKKEPNVAAELLRRKEAAGGAAASDTLATL